MAKQTKSKTRTTAKKQGFQFRWWMGLGLVVIIALIGAVVVRFSNAGNSYPNGCWILNQSKNKYQYESSPSSCQTAQNRGRTIKAANSKPTVIPPSNSYPNGCDIYLSNRGSWSYERDPGSCQNAANQGKQVRQPNHEI